MAKSWKPEVIADSSGEWCGNALRFATKEEAEMSASSLAMRWTAVRDWRATECDDAVNYAIVDGKMEEAKAPAMALPEGVTMILLECPAEIHSILAKALGEQQ